MSLWIPKLLHSAMWHHIPDNVKTIYIAKFRSFPTAHQSPVPGEAAAQNNGYISSYLRLEQTLI